LQYWWGETCGETFPLQFTTLPQRYQRLHSTIAAAAAAACVLFTLVDLIIEAKELLLASYFQRRCNSCKQLMCSEFAVFGKPRSTQLVYTQRGNTLRVGLQLGPFSISSSDVLF